jgi:hypothetical protein
MSLSVGQFSDHFFGGYHDHFSNHTLGSLTSNECPIPSSTKGYKSSFFTRLATAALSPYWAIMGAVGVFIGWVYQALWAVPMGIIGAGMVIWYVWRCTRDYKGFEKAFGADWTDKIPPEQARHMVQKRWTWYLKMKASPAPSFERDTDNSIEQHQVKLRYFYQVNGG